MKKKFISIFIALVLASSLCLMTAVPVSATGTPAIDGVISAGEWDGAVEFVGTDYSVYVLSDTEYLYIAFEAVGGDFIAYPGMTNIYIYAGDDWAGECWAYTALGQDEVVGLTYFTTHHILPPKVKEGQESRSTTAIVKASTLAMEWKIPLAEFPMGPGDSLAFDFMSYSEGYSSWSTAWLYNQEYTLAPPTKARSDNAKGAVKADLTVYEKGDGDLLKGTVVGSVILNTTASDSLIVVIKIDDVPNLEDYDVRVHIIDDDGPKVYFTFEDVLSTNRKGNGNAQVKVNLLDESGKPRFTGQTIGVDVVLRPNFVDEPLATPSYTTDWPTDVIVPLK